MTDELAQGRTFGEMAEEFDRIRPGYPDDLVDDVLAYAGGGTGGGGTGSGVRAVEVGAGTGKATTAFAARGVRVTAVELDPAMAALLEQRLDEASGVRIVLSPFEDYVPDTAFELLYCAQAWHWTDPDTRWRHAARALAPGGAIALFWNYDRIADGEVRDGVRAIHRELAPRILIDDEPADGADLAALWPGTELAELPEFGELTERIYLWERTLSAYDYLCYLSTQPTYRMLGGDARNTLFNALAQQLPDKVTLSVETLLYLGRRVA